MSAVGRPRTASSVYESLESKRNSKLRLAQAAVRLTIPNLIPQIGQNDTTIIPTPYQSIGARGVNNLSSKLLMALFPTHVPFFHLGFKAKAKHSILSQQGGADLLFQYQTQLDNFVRDILDDWKSGRDRGVLFEAIRHLVVAGNGLLYMPIEEETAEFYRLDQYVLSRDSAGRPVESVIKESQTVAHMDEKYRKQIESELDADQDKVTVFTWIRWDRKQCHWHQECCEKILEGTEGSRPINKAPWIPLWWQHSAGLDYADGLVMEYIGDVVTVEDLNKAIVQFSAAAAKILYFLDPNSYNDEEEIQNAESGDVLRGRKTDLEAFTLDKYADFRVALETAQGTEQRLAQAFLLMSGSVRQAERVTADEIRKLAQELEDTLGGVYTVLATVMQQPVARILVARGHRQGYYPHALEKYVDARISAGFDALGRNREAQQLMNFFAVSKNVFGNLAEAYFKVENGMKKLASVEGIPDAGEFIKTEEEVQSAQHTQMLNAVIGKTVPGVANEIIKSQSQGGGS